jgi:hypothetical protein
MATIEELSAALIKADAAGNATDAKVFADTIRQMQSQQAQPAAAQMPVERPDLLETPREFAGRPPEQVGATLGDLVPPPELAADLLKAKSPEGGAPTELNVQAIYGQLEQTGSIRDVLNKEVASGGLNPTATLDPQQYPVLAPIWEQYKKEMDPSMIGAATRGAVSQVGPTLGGVAGGAAGSMLGPVGAVGGGVAGAMAGGMAQEGLVSEFQTPQQQAVSQAQAAFDEARARGSRAVGEALPQLATLRPALGTLQKAFTGDAASIAAVAIGSALGGGIPAAMGGGTERAVVGAVTGGLLEPRQMTGRLMQRPLRTEQRAQEVAGGVVRQFATEAGGIPEALAMRVEGAAPALTGGGVTPLTSEISGNEGLISLGNALANTNAGLRQVRAESRAATARNISEALQQRGATFQEAEQFLVQQRQKLLDDAQAASEAFIQSGDTAAAQILSDSIARAEAAKTAAAGVVQTAESMLESAQQALEAARAKISARGGVKNQASTTAKTVLNEERESERVAVNKLYDDVKVAGLKSAAKNTYKAALEAKGAKGAGLWGDLPDPIQRIITTLQPPKKGAAPEVTVQDLMSGIRTLNGKIRASTDPNEQRLLTLVKNAMDEDIQALGSVHSDLAVANAAYRSYASRYKDRAARGVFNKFAGTEDSKTLDVFLNGPIEGVRQLKDALKGRPEGVQSVQDWIVNDLASSVGDSATPAKVNAWLSKRNVEGWLQEFPEALPTINAYLQEVTQASEAVSATGAAVSTAKRQLRGPGTDVMARQDAATIRDAARRTARVQLKTAQESVASSAAEKVIGASPVNAITSVMESKNPERAARELMGLTAKDSSGKATEGLQNAVREWMDNQVTRFGEVVSTIDDPTTTLTMDQLAKSYAQLNGILTKDSDTRKAVQAVLGNKELNKLDVYRGQIEVMERFRRAAAGQSVTSLNTELKKQLDDKMANNLLGVLGRFAYNVIPPSAKFGVTGTAIRSLSELTSNLTWTGDPSGRARQIMLKAMTDKDLMAKLLRPIDKATLPEAKTFIKTYLVPQGAEQPQQESQ